MTERPELTDRDRAMIELEAGRNRSQGAHEERVRVTFGMSLARYYQVLNRLLDAPAAIEAYPIEVKRLRRLRDRRLADRASRVYAK